MASINYATREISCKIVFYGPGLSGKTTNLQIIHRKIPDKDKSEMVSLATETDRTLFFDFLPLDLGSIKGFSTKFQLYTVPGQVYYNATRKLVLRGVDGVVFVVDSQIDKLQENLESFANLQENLREYGHSIDSIPLVLQYNKRDLPNVYPVDQLTALFNKQNLPYCEAVAATGVGVFTTLKAIGKLVIDRFNAKYAGFQGGARRMQPGQSTQAPAAPMRPAAPMAPPPPPPQDPRRGAPAMNPFQPGNPPMPQGQPMDMPQFPGQPSQNSAGGFPPNRDNPFMTAPPAGPPFSQPMGQPPPGPGQPPFMIPTPFQTPPNAPSTGAFPTGTFPAGGAQPNPGFSGTPSPFQSGSNPFQNPTPGPMGGRGPNPGFPPPGGPPLPSPFGAPNAPATRSPFSGDPRQAPFGGQGGQPPMGNVPVSPFLDSFNAPKAPGAGGNPPVMPGLETSSPFSNAPPQPRGPGAGPFQGYGGGPGQPFPGAQAPFPPPGAPGSGGFPGQRGPMPEQPFHPQDPKAVPDPQPPAVGSGSGGLRGSIGDSSGIVSTYEDEQRDENFKTRKLPLPGEKKKGFFDGLFRKDK